MRLMNHYKKIKACLITNFLVSSNLFEYKSTTYSNRLILIYGKEWYESQTSRVRIFSATYLPQELQNISQIQVVLFFAHQICI